ncbi:3bdd3172-8828-4099-8408-f3d14d6c6f64 [Thermothielavioides terrestris]|uniref:3bdd3172-8828-4099-8408-f3d14d6c6f64 n=1 Tax=Thermothielavioides terrestris TaxID=2587410 RepID=A0A3S4D4R0_9PEZI|nr:3bdd3172-8828-4099-8408-f3d14d6c6f64 [Thermothielavioides terrestris]
MASQNPATPVKVPSAAANYTAATLDPDLRSQINSLLIKEGHVTKIQDHLLHALHAHPSNWPTTVQNHALSLLRSGEVSSFPALLRRVIEDVRQDTALSPNANGSTGKAVNGASEENGGGAGGVNGKKAEGVNGATNNARPSLAVPQSVVEEALLVTRECLDAVCEMEESGAT